jgi:hypothetical protein
MGRLQTLGLVLVGVGLALAALAATAVVALLTARGARGRCTGPEAFGAPGASESSDSCPVVVRNEAGSVVSCIDVGEDPDVRLGDFVKEVHVSPGYVFAAFGEPFYGGLLYHGRGPARGALAEGGLVRSYRAAFAFGRAGEERAECAAYVRARAGDGVGEDLCMEIGPSHVEEASWRGAPRFVEVLRLAPYTVIEAYSGDELVARVVAPLREVDASPPKAKDPGRPVTRIRLSRCAATWQSAAGEVQAVDMPILGTAATGPRRARNRLAGPMAGVYAAGGMTVYGLGQDGEVVGALTGPAVALGPALGRRWHDVAVVPAWAATAGVGDAALYELAGRAGRSARVVADYGRVPLAVLEFTPAFLVVSRDARVQVVLEDGAVEAVSGPREVPVGRWTAVRLLGPG